MSAEIKKILLEFDNLDSAFIDASSIIYLLKIGIFDLVSSGIRLFTINEIKKEAGALDLNIIIYKEKFDRKIPNDLKLIYCALKLKVPIISDDKKILLYAQKKRLNYYNSLMILNFLLYKNKISEQEFEKYFKKLLKIAWYSKKVVEFSRKILIKVIH